MTHLCNQGYITIMEHRYSKLEIPTQYFQEHFASFPKISFKRSLFLWFSHTLFSASFMQVFFFLFLQLHLHSVDFPRKKSAVGFSNRLCFTQKRNHLRNKKKFTLPLNAKLQAKCQNNFSTFFMTLKKHSQLSTYFGVVSSETSL